MIYDICMLDSMGFGKNAGIFEDQEQLFSMSGAYDKIIKERIQKIGYNSIASSTVYKSKLREMLK